MFLKIAPNRIINLDQVVDFEFYPAHEEKVEGQSTMTLSRPAELFITTTAQMIDSELGYEGAVIGIATRSQVIRLIGQDAEDLFKHMQSSCYPLYPDPMKGKPQ